MKKRIKYLSLIFLFVLIFAAGCADDESWKNSLPGNESGYRIFCITEPGMTTYYSAYRLPKVIFDKDDVTVEISYGDLYPGGGDKSYSYRIYLHNRRKFRPENETNHLVKEIPSLEFQSQLYKCHIGKKWPDGLYSLEFNHTETITIPPDLFLQDEGNIRISYVVYNIEEDKLESEFMFNIIRYWIDDDNENKIHLNIPK